MNITPMLLPHGLNHRTGRRRPITTICDHVTEGSAAAVKSWFKNPAAEVSSHYMVQMDGVIIQFVSEDDEAWAQGRVDHPTAKVVLENPGVNPNSYCVSIEHEGDGHHDLTDPQRASSVWLHRDIASRRGLTLNRDTVIGHHEVYSLKTCPGKIDIDRIVREAVGNSPVFLAPPPIVVWSEYAGDWLLVTRHDSDTDWSYQPISTIKGGAKASTPLSQMPRTR